MGRERATLAERARVVCVCVCVCARLMERQTEWETNQDEGGGGAYWWSSKLLLEETGWKGTDGVGWKEGRKSRGAR